MITITVIIFISLYILRIFASFIILPVEDLSSSGRKLAAIVNVFQPENAHSSFLSKTILLLTSYHAESTF